MRIAPSLRQCARIVPKAGLVRAMFLALPVSPLVAQSAGSLRPELDSLRAWNEWTLDQQRSICEIPAPTFHEQDRALEYRRRLEAAGLTRVRIDSIGNVIAERPGRSRKPVVVISAHLDTVFPEGTDVTVKREGRVMRGPGISDDCRGLTVLQAVARALHLRKVETAGTIIFAATVREEGLGNSAGVRHLLQRELVGEVDFFVTVDLPRGFEISNRAVGSHRYQVVFHGPGGHSYNAFGMPNPVHALGRAIGAIADLPVPMTPRTTFSVGVVQGGRTVNSIADSATMLVDLRSESPAHLDTLDSQFRRAVNEAAAEERARWPGSKEPLEVAINAVGIKPAGFIADSSRLVRVALEMARTLGVENPERGAYSTDANFPLSMGIPALAIGSGGRGQGGHSLAELYDDGEQGWLGPQWVLLIATTLAGLR